MTASNPVFPLELSTDWYRQPSVKVAFVLSLLVHAAAIAFLPGLRVPKPMEPAPLVVELVASPVPATPAPIPMAAPEPRRVVQPPPPVQKQEPEPPPPPPIIRQDLKPELPKPEAQPAPPPETRLPPQPEPRPEPRPQPLPEPRVEAPPPAAAQPRIEPQAEAPPAPRVQPPAPVVPPLPPAFDPSVLKTYGSVLAEAIGKKKSYPRIARLRNWQGTTELRLLLSPEGKLKDVTVARTSGFEVLDHQAISMVKESLPLPEVPESLRGREFAINVPVAFKLQ